MIQPQNADELKLRGLVAVLEEFSRKYQAGLITKEGGLRVGDNAKAKD